MMYKKKVFLASAFHFPFDRFVIWGLRSERDTYRYIHSGFWNTAKKIGVPVIWIDNNKINARIIRKNDLILAVNVARWNLPVVEGAYYCLHNFTLEKINPRYLLHLQVYTSNAVSGANEIDNMTYLNHESRTLFQAWGTDLLPWKFASRGVST